MTKTIGMILVLFLAFCLPLFAMGNGEKNADKVYVFATDATWPPMEYVDEKGDTVGFDIDLITAVAEAAGFQYKVQNTGWDGIFAGLVNGAYDGIVSSVTITEERQKSMDFSTPYVNAGQILVVRTDYEGGNQLHDFIYKKVGVQQGTTGDFAIEEVPEIVRLAYDEVSLAFEALIIGNLDAVVCDSIVAADYVFSNKRYVDRLKILGEPYTNEQFGIVVQKGNAELLDLINKGLAAISLNGKKDMLVDKWLR